MSFFEEEMQRIEKDVQRQFARNEIHQTIAKTVGELVIPAQRRVTKTRLKMAELSVELIEAENSLANLEAAKNCDHEFVDAGGGMGGPWQEKCKHCNWVHYC